MSEKIDFLGVIPARGGSKGVPGKNIKMIAGKPLIAWSIESAKAAGKLDCFVVSTDDKEIADIARQYGAEVIIRPAELASDEALMLPVLDHALDQYDSRNVVLLQPTSPVRDDDLIDRCIEKYLEDGADNMATGFMCKYQEYGTYTARRQDLQGFFYNDGNVVIISAELIRKGTMFGDKTVRFEISKEQNFEIDDEFDFWMIEHVLLKQKDRCEG